MRIRVLGGVVCLLVAVAPRAASADWLVTPFAGVTFGGDTNGQHVVYGGSIGYMGKGVVGFDVDFGYTPQFFDPDDDPLELIDSSNVTTLMANIVIGVPFGGTSGTGFRPYVSGGGGWLRSRVSDADDLFTTSNDSFGVDVGAGAIGFVNDHIGIRGDIRYFRSLQDPEEDNEFDIDFGDFDFWRGTVGVTFRF